MYTINIHANSDIATNNSSVYNKGMTNKKPHGNTKQNPAGQLVNFRCTASEKATWNAKAKAAGYSSLSAWLKGLANQGIL